MPHKIVFLPVLFALCLGCHRAPRKLDPQLHHIVQERYIQHLPAPFPPLSSKEQQTPWGQEYLIGVHFAKELDLYRAISTFKRARILAPLDATQRRFEIDYYIVYCYYLGERYQEAASTFENSSLSKIAPSFPTYDDLLVILYEVYSRINNPQRAQVMLEMLRQFNPEKAQRLTAGEAILSANFTQMQAIAPPYAEPIACLMATYNREKKSMAKAEGLNAVLPGAGYLYVGQKQSACTAFLLNGLFIAAAVHFFQKGHIAAGIITTSIEMGWYFGGIYGAGEAAKLYNERLYEKTALPVLQKNRLFPIFSISYGF